MFTSRLSDLNRTQFCVRDNYRKLSWNFSEIIIEKTIEIFNIFDCFVIFHDYYNIWYKKMCQINSWKHHFDKEIIDFDHLKKKIVCVAEKSEINYINFENLRTFRVVYRFLVGNPDLI